MLNIEIFWGQEMISCKEAELVVRLCGHIWKPDFISFFLGIMVMLIILFCVRILFKVDEK